MFITAAVLAEICSALPAAGSIYFWAAESGGPRYGRLFGFIVAWWSTTAWTTFIASVAQAAANFLLSEITVFELPFPTDVNNIKFRAVQWIVSEIFLFLGLSMNYLNPKTYRTIFRIATALIILDFLLNMIWLPIAVSKSYGFQDASYVFTKTLNETGAPPVWNWMLSYYVTAGILVGFEAAGHISEVRTALRIIYLHIIDYTNATIGDAERQLNGGARNLLVGRCICPNRISGRYLVPLLPSRPCRALRTCRSAAIRADLRNDHGSWWPRLHECNLHHRITVQYHDRWGRQLSSDLGCRSRWRSTLLWLDLSSFCEERAEECDHRHACCSGFIAVHDLGLSRGLYLACECIWSTDDYRLRARCIRSMLHYSAQFQACCIQSWPLEPSNDIHRPGVEHLPCRSALLAAFLPGHCCVLQLLSGHLCRDHHLRHFDMVLHSGR